MKYSWTAFIPLLLSTDLRDFVNSRINVENLSLIKYTWFIQLFRPLYYYKRVQKCKDPV